MKTARQSQALQVLIEQITKGQGLKTTGQIYVVEVPFLEASKGQVSKTYHAVQLIHAPSEATSEHQGLQVDQFQAQQAVTEPVAKGQAPQTGKAYLRQALVEGLPKPGRAVTLLGDDRWDEQECHVDMT